MNTATTAAFAITGLLAGLAFFGSLRWLATRLVHGGRGAGWGRLAAVQGLRLLLMAAVLVAASRQGAAALLACAAGVLAARAWLLARARREARR